MTAYLIMLAVAMLLLLPVYLIIRRHLLRKRHSKPFWPREILLAFFVLFCGALAVLVFDGFAPWHWHPNSIAAVLAKRFTTGENINLIPFHIIMRYFVLMDASGGGMNIFAVNLFGNVLMLVPIGFCLPLFWQRWQKWWKMLLVAILLPLTIETIQLLLPRSVDVDDLLLNATGILLGVASLLCHNTDMARVESSKRHLSIILTG